MPKVSVIIPIYNVEKYLKQCLDSVVNQTLQDIEIICVNDGSTDNSLEILKEYAEKDSRLRIINLRNSGVSVARNIGIFAALADFIMFVDADDSIETTTCEYSLNRIIETKTDICCFGVNEKCGNVVSSRDWEAYYLQFDNEPELVDLEAKKVFVVNVYGKLIRKSFLIDKNILFAHGIKTGEDSIFNLSCLIEGATYSILNKFLYNYNISRVGSASNNLKNALKNDIEGYEYFLASNCFKNSSDEMKIIVFEKFIGQMQYYYSRTVKYKLLYISQILKFNFYLDRNIPKQLLNDVSNIKFIRLSHFIQLVFSITNEKHENIKHKVLTIMGIKIKFKKEKVND